jgi:CheY-like chemotaxis protein
MDIEMPRMDGLAAARELRRREGKRLLLIAISGRTSALDKSLALQAGFDVHMSKPVDWAALRSCMESGVVIQPGPPPPAP